MPRGRPPKAPPVQPPPESPDAEDEQDEERDGEGGDDGAPDEEPLRPGAAKRSPLDEQVGSPGASAGGPVQFTPGFGGPTRPAIPPLTQMPWMMPQGARPAVPASPPPMAQQAAPATSYGSDDADPIESEVQEQSDASLSRLMLSQFSGDMRVNVEVWQCDGAQNIPRGMLEDVMLSYACVPTRYVPYGGAGGSGKWFFEFRSAATGKPIRRFRCTLPGDEPPADYRVENVVAEQEVLKALGKLLAGGGGVGGTGIPPGAYADEKAWLRQQIEDQKKTLEQMRMDFERRDREAERQRFEERIRQLESGGGGQNQVLQTIAALAPFIQQQGKSSDDRLVDIVLQMNGPSMMQAQAAMYNEILGAASKLGHGEGGDGGWKTMIGGALKDAVEKYMGTMEKRQEQHDKWMRERAEKKEREAAAKASGGQPPAAQPGAAAEKTGGNGDSTDKKLFARMLKDFRQAVEKVGSKDVPESEKPTSDDVATKLVLCFRTTLELGLHKSDQMIDQMTSDVLKNPEMFMAKWCEAYGTSADFGARVARQFRKMTDLPPLEQPPAPKPTEASPAASTPPAAEPPAPSKTTSSTVRLPSSPPSRQPEAPVAADAGPRPPVSVAAVEPTTEEIVADAKRIVDDALTEKLAEATTRRKRSPKVQGQDAEVGKVAEPQGPVHVVDVGPQAPAAERVEVRDAQPEGGEPPQKDGGGLVDAAHPAGEVEQPTVPQPPSVVVEPDHS